MLSVDLKSHFEPNLVSLKTTKNFALFFLFQVTFSVFSSPRIYCIIKFWVPLKQFPSKNFHRKLSSFYIFVNFLRGNLFIKRIPSFAHWQHEKKLLTELLNANFCCCCAFVSDLTSITFIKLTLGLSQHLDKFISFPSHIAGDS